MILKPKGRLPPKKSNSSTSANTPKHHHGSNPPISVNATKSQIRSLTRLLSNPTSTLPAPILVEKERQLASLQRSLASALEAQKTSKLIGKYHKIRFFERQKASRALKRAKRAVALWSSWLLEKEQEREVVDDEEGGGKMERLKREVRICEVDVAYAINYPLTERYVALFPKGAEEGGEGKEIEKPPVWKVVEQCLEEGTLDSLREGKLGVRPDGSVRTNEKEAATGDRRTNEATGRPVSEPKNEDQDGSDGGFFEE